MITPAKQPEAEVVVIDGLDRGLRVAVGFARFSIGRGKDDDVRLRDILVTRRQLVVE